MIKNIENLRLLIENIDEKIIFLLKKRLKIIEKIGILKNELQIPSYIKDKEKDILEYKIKKYKFLNKDFIKDIFRRIIYESYNIENKNIIFKKSKLYKILFIYKKNFKLNLIKEFFIKYSYKVYSIYYKNLLNIFFIKNINYYNFIFLDINVIYYKKFLSYIIKNNKKNNIILISNNKNISYKKIKKNNIFSLYIDFLYEKNNLITCLTKETVFIINIKNNKKNNNFFWLIKQFKLWGIKIINIDYKNYIFYKYKIKSIIDIILLTYTYYIKNINLNINNIFNFYNKNYKCIISNFIYIQYFNSKEIIDNIFDKKNLLLLKNFNIFLTNIIKYIENNNKKNELFKMIHSDKFEKIINFNKSIIKNINKYT